MNNCLVEMLANAASQYADKTALIYNQHSDSYAQLWDKVCALAAGMRELGLKRGDRLLISMGNHPDTIACFWAAQKLGACPSVIAADTSLEKWAFILKNSGAAQVFVDRAVADTLSPLDLGTFTELNHVIVQEAEVEEQGPQRLALAALGGDAEAEKARPLAPISQDLAAIIYTSGSTGAPKGVMLSHMNMMAATRSLSEYLGYRSDDVIMAALPLAFDYGFYQVILATYVGACVVLEPQNALPTQVLRDIQAYGCTVMPGLSSLYTLLDTYSRMGQFDLSSVRLVSNTGMALRLPHIEMVQRLFPRAEIFSMYGLTECKRCTYLPPGDVMRKPQSVGGAIPNMQITVIDEAQRECQPGEVGQLIIRSDLVMQGYWRNPEATAKRLGLHPVYGDKCLFSGDYGWLDEEGHFHFVGRMDEVAKIRGLKVVLSHVEKAVYRDSKVEEVAVVAVDLPEYSESVLVAYVAGKGIQAADLHALCQQTLKAHERPQQVVVLSRLPKNANGKFDKQVLKQRFIKQHSAREQAQPQGQFA